MTLSAASAAGSSNASSAARTAASASGGCATCIDARRQTKPRAQRLRRPVENRIEGEPLALGQRLGLFRPVAEQVGAGVARDLGPRLVHRLRHAVDRRVEQPGDRHVGRIDRLALPRPFLGDRAP